MHMCIRVAVCNTQIKCKFINKRYYLTGISIEWTNFLYCILRPKILIYSKTSILSYSTKSTLSYSKTSILSME